MVRRVTKKNAKGGAGLQFVINMYIRIAKTPEDTKIVISGLFMVKFGKWYFILNGLVIMEYFVKIRKKARILELKRRNLKNTILTSYTSYPSKKIRRICAYTSQETTKNKDLYAVSMRSNTPISFDESDDEDYTVIYDKSSFSYKIISVNDLKTDSENDNDKVNMPSFSSSEPTVEPTISPQHIDELNLKNETSLSECDGEEQNVIYFNDIFPFNIIYPDDLKSDKDNDNDKIDIKQSSEDITAIPSPNVINTDVDSYAQGSNKLLETSHDTISKNFTAKNLSRN
ncbi:hypothetical protein Tco_1217356 [Tanacetum coccineum]